MLPMGKTYNAIDDKLAAFIAKQKMFFVATAPLSPDGHVNLSPKGYDAFRIVSPKQVAYADLGGSGIETVAHARENGRITIMFCAFDGPALILRLYGKARVMQFDEPAPADSAKNAYCRPDMSSPAHHSGSTARNGITGPAATAAERAA